VDGWFTDYVLTIHSKSSYSQIGFNFLNNCFSWNKACYDRSSWVCGVLLNNRLLHETSVTLDLQLELGNIILDIRTFDFILVNNLLISFHNNCQF